MLDSIYVGLTGLTGFSDGLRNISNNVANINTPGFKGTDLQFQDLFYHFQAGVNTNGDQSSLFKGSGLSIGGTTILFRQGELRQTGNDLDTAIQGNGFFVLRQDDKTLFTRDGQFSIDADGFLTNRAGDARIQGLVNGQLVDIDTGPVRISPAKATATVKFAGNLSSGDSDGVQVISNLTVFDGAGGSQTLKVTFTNNSAVTPRSWLIRVEDAAGNLIDDTGEIQFNGDGSPLAGFTTHTFTFTPPGGAPQSITFDFGIAGGFSGATNFSAGADSTLAVSSQDGFASGAITKATVGPDGTLILTYSNGQTAKPAQLALAWFDFLQGLEPTGGNDFENSAGLTMRLGTAQTSLFGSITAGSIESANVDLGQEFTDLVVIQRGYQASSQVITVANEMIQTLLDIKGPRG
jgi:flagellar hook protein FlgE